MLCGTKDFCFKKKCDRITMKYSRLAIRCIICIKTSEGELERMRTKSVTKNMKRVISAFTFVAVIVTTVLSYPLTVTATSKAITGDLPSLELQVVEVIGETINSDNDNCILQRIISLLEELAHPEKEEILEHLLELQLVYITDEEREELDELYKILEVIKEIERLPSHSPEVVYVELLEEEELAQVIEKIAEGEEIILGSVLQPFWFAGNNYHQGDGGTHQWLSARGFAILRNERSSAFQWFSSYANGRERVIRFSDWPDWPESGERYPILEFSLAGIPVWRQESNNRHFYHLPTGTNLLNDQIDRGENAVTRFEYWYNRAVEHYLGCDKEDCFRAFEYLGKSIHFLADLGSPPHIGDIAPADTRFRTLATSNDTITHVQMLNNRLCFLNTGLNHLRYEVVAHQLRKDFATHGGGHYHWVEENIPLRELAGEIARYSYGYYPRSQSAVFATGVCVFSLLGKPQYRDAIGNPLLASQRNIAGILYRFFYDVHEGMPPVFGEPSPNYPIIILPGIMGSNLYSSSTSFTRLNRVWAPDISNNIFDIGMVFGLGNNIRMRNTLFPRPMTNMNLSGARREYGAIQLYRSLVDYLIDVFPEREIYFFAYDFRQDNRVLATRLNEGIEQILSSSDYDKVELVAHSMGGLVIASYISQFSADSLGRVITIGTPYEGAPQVFAALLQGEVSGNFFGDLALSLLGNLGPDVSSEFPSAAQLAPTQAYFEENPFYGFSHTTGLIIRRRHYLEMSYQQYFNKLDSFFRWGQRRNFVEAEAFHQSMLSEGVNVLAAYEQAYFAIGVNQRTIRGIKFDSNSFLRNRPRISDLIYESYGDGTVPYASQMMMGQLETIDRVEERVRRFDAHHRGLVERNPGEGWYKDTIAWVVDILQGNARVTQVYDVELQNSSFIVLRIEGLVDVTIESPEGILTSVQDEPSLIAPFGRLDKIGDEGEIIMLALEEWEDYEVILHVPEDGLLDYTIRWFDEEDNLVDERIFTDIPLFQSGVVTSSTAREAVTVLEIDRYGDGSIQERWEAQENNSGNGLGERRDSRESSLPDNPVDSDEELLLLMADGQNTDGPHLGYLAPTRGHLIHGANINQEPITLGSNGSHLRWILLISPLLLGGLLFLLYKHKKKGF